jgi:predicted MFS family arabinose efflux permease
MVFLVELAPGFSTPLFYYQTDTLKFDGQFVGFLSGVNSLSGVIAGIVYVYGCRRFPLRNLLVASVLFHAAGSLAYLGYHSKITAVWIEAVGGFGAVLAQIPLFDLAARATPRGSEAIGYSLIMSVWNFGTNASDVLGAWLFDAYRLNVTHLVWLNAGSTLLVLGVLPFLPTFLADRPDEGPAPPSHLDENGGRDCPL